MKSLPIDYVGLIDDYKSYDIPTLDLHPRAFDISDGVIGLLTVIRPVGRKWSRLLWLCRCSCGNYLTRDTDSLGRQWREGTKSNCGCTLYDDTYRPEDLIGKVIRNYTVIDYFPLKRRAKVQCSCGAVLERGWVTITCKHRAPYCMKCTPNAYNRRTRFKKVGEQIQIYTVLNVDERLKTYLVQCTTCGHKRHRTHKQLSKLNHQKHQTNGCPKCMFWLRDENGNLINLQPGERYGLFTIIAPAKAHKRSAHTVCICGRTATRRVTEIISGRDSCHCMSHIHRGIGRDKLETKPGYIYAVQCCSRDNYIKIGYTSSPKTRFASMTTDNPYSIKQLLLVPGTFLLEQLIHLRILPPHHVKGEWFTPHQEVLQLLEQLKTIGAQQLVNSYSLQPPLYLPPGA